MSDKLNFRRTPATETLLSRLQKLDMGDVVTYGELSALIGDNVQTKGIGVLVSARRIAERDFQIVTDTINNIGLKRLTDQEAIKSGHRFRRKVRSAARRGVRRVNAAHFGQLPDEYKLLRNMHLSVFGAIDMFTRRHSVEKLGSAVNITATGQLSIGETLALFNKAR